MCTYRNFGLRLLLTLLFFASTVYAQGGPPFYTNDPHTPGNLNWEINLGYVPFLYSDQSVSHVPDVDLNFGIGDRIQLTYENAWLRVRQPASNPKFGLGQSNVAVKWRFYDTGENGLAVSVFPQLFVNNPNNSVRRGVAPKGQSFLLPIEFTKRIGPVNVNYEFGYQFVQKGPDGWIMGFVIGHEFAKKLEIDLELYSSGTFHPSESQPTIGVGGRYKLHSPILLLFMAGRGLESTNHMQSYFVGYFGLQFLLPPKSYKSD
jgi:Putative MetA-pathway of phenol degradation